MRIIDSAFSCWPFRSGFRRTNAIHRGGTSRAPVAPPDRDLADAIVTTDTGTFDALDSSPEARYVNYFEVGFNAFEVVLGFAQSYGATRTSPSLRLVMSPVYAKEFLAMLTSALTDYESAFHRIENR
jgi:Protein of unknown function (DUF3467)